jgi:hypothetical protein
MISSAVPAGEVFVHPPYLSKFESVYNTFFVIQGLLIAIRPAGTTTAAVGWGGEGFSGFRVRLFAVASWI